VKLTFRQQTKVNGFGHLPAGYVTISRKKWHGALVIYRRFFERVEQLMFSNQPAKE